jgi:hypothetical protein
MFEVTAGLVRHLTASRPMASRGIILFRCGIGCSSTQGRRSRRFSTRPGSFMRGRRHLRSILLANSAWRNFGGESPRADTLQTVIRKPCRRPDARTAFVGGPLIPWVFVVSVVRSLGSHLGYLLRFERVQKLTEKPACGTGTQCGKLLRSDPVRFPFSPGV